MAQTLASQNTTHQTSGSKPKPVSSRAFSKISVKAQTVLPPLVRQALGIKPGDRLAYILEGDTIRIERATDHDGDNPFASFSEWDSVQDHAAYDSL